MNSSLQLCLNQLLSNVKAAGISRNAVVSSVSVRAAVAMLGTGCSGRSLDQVLQFFGFETASELKPNFCRSMAILNRSEIPIVNGAWIDKRRSFKPSYQECLRDTFKAEVKTQDFVNQADEAVKDINSWADNHTKGLIDNIINHIDPSTAVILEEKDFHLENGEKVSNAAFMVSSTKSYRRHASFEDFKVVEIPCENRLTVKFVLPEKMDGLKDVLEKLIADPKLLEERKSGDQFEFWIPKFNFSYTFDDIKLGSEKVDLGEMLLQPAGIGEEVVDGIKVVQKVRIEVDEKGTEAAAIEPRSAYSSKRLNFVADRPYTFIITDTLTGLVILVGTVMNPLQDATD